jgi:hypothetical protein
MSTAAFAAKWVILAYCCNLSVTTANGRPAPTLFLSDKSVVPQSKEASLPLIAFVVQMMIRKTAPGM